MPQVKEIGIHILHYCTLGLLKMRTYVYSILPAARYTAAAFHCTFTVPSVSRLLSVTHILSDGFELNWLPPREPNGRPVYEIEYGTDDTNFTTVDTGSGDTYYNLTGLQHNTTYYIRVVAVNYVTLNGLPLRGEKSETVTGVLVPEPGGDTTGGHCIQNTNMYCDMYSDMYSECTVTCTVTCTETCTVTFSAYKLRLDCASTWDAVASEYIL